MIIMLDEVRARKKEGWIDAVFNIEAMAVNPEVAKKSLADHVAKIENVRELLVYEKSFSDVEEVKNPPKKVEKAYSQIVEIKMLVKNVTTLIHMVLLFGPSSIEIIGPKTLEIKIDELQSLANAIAGIMHQFAQAGIGGVVITPDK